MVLSMLRPQGVSGPISCKRPFFKILRHNPLLVELDELNWMVPEFSKLDNGKLLLAGVLCLVAWHSRDRSRDLVTTSNSNCARLSAKIARMGCRSFEHSAPIYSYTCATWSWFKHCPFKSYMFTFEILIIMIEILISSTILWLSMTVLNYWIQLFLLYWSVKYNMKLTMNETRSISINRQFESELIILNTK